MCSGLNGNGVAALVRPIPFDDDVAVCDVEGMCSERYLAMSKSADGAERTT